MCFTSPVYHHTANTIPQAGDTRNTMDSYNFNGSLKTSCLSSATKQKGPASLYTMTGSGAQMLLTRKKLLMSTNMHFWQQIRNKGTCNSPTEKYILSRPITDISFEAKLRPNSIDQTVLKYPYSILNAIKNFFSNMLCTMIQTGLKSAIGAYFPYLISQTSCSIDCDAKPNIYMDLMPDPEKLAFLDCYDFDNGTDVVDAIIDYKRFDFCYEGIPTPIPITFSSSSSPPKNEFSDCFETITASKEPTVIEKPFNIEFENLLNTHTDVKKVETVCQIKIEDNKKLESPKENMSINKTVQANGPIKTKEKLKLNKQQLQKHQQKIQPQQQQQPHEKTSSPCQNQSNSDLNQQKTSKNYRRNQRKKRRKAKRQRGCTGLDKNRNEKSRHELEQNIHDDIEDSMKFDHWNQEEDSFETAKASTSAPLPASMSGKPSSQFENSWTSFNVTPSDDRLSEKKRTGCIFTSFINFELNDITKKLRPAPDLTKKTANRNHHHHKQQQHQKQKQSAHRQRQPKHQRKQRLPKPLDLENDENFIVFDENSPRRSFFWEPMSSDFQVTATSSCLPNTLLHRSRQRQLSECSDDFICFEYDDNDYAARMQCDNQTTEEEFTDDDDDDENVDETDSENDIDCSSVENNPPDSGFEEKKVIIEIRIFI